MSTSIGCQVLKMMDSMTKESVKEIIQVQENTVDPLPKHLIGNFEQKADDIMDYLDLSNKREKWVGIWGVAGVGKSVLAQIVCNNANKKNPECAHSHTIGRKKTTIEIENMCKKVWTQEKKKKLLILDEVWDSRHLEVVHKHAPSDSKVVVTTRNKSIVDQFHMEEVYLTEFSVEDRWDLFCFYACGPDKEKWPARTMSPMGMLVEMMEGLPEMLRIWCRSMAGKKEHELDEECVIALRKLRDTSSLDALTLERSKMSYDDLYCPRGHLQQCFLILAASNGASHIRDMCNEWKAHNLIRDMDECRDVLKQFSNRSLIKEDDDGICTMNDIYLRLAKHIMHHEKPGEYVCIANEDNLSRDQEEELFSQPDKLCHIYLQANNLEKVPPITAPRLRALNLDDNPLNSGFQKDFFKGFPNLEYLSLDRVKCKVPIRKLGCLKNLETLYLSRDGDVNDSNMYTCREGKRSESIKQLIYPDKPRLHNLQFLSLEGYCPRSFSRCMNLKEVSLTISYRCLLHLSTTIGHLSKLESLYLAIENVSPPYENKGNNRLFAGTKFPLLQKFCMYLTDLPEFQKAYISELNFEAFPKLKILALSNLQWEKLGISCLSQLEELEIHDPPLYPGLIVSPYCYDDRKVLSYLDIDAYDERDSSLKLKCLPPSCEFLEDLSFNRESDFPALKRLFTFNKIPSALDERNIHIQFHETDEDEDEDEDEIQVEEEDEERQDGKDEDDEDDETEVEEEDAAEEEKED